MTAEQPCAERVTFRLCTDEEDWWAVRRLLIQTYEAAPPYWNWEMRRWDGQRFHSETTELSAAQLAQIGLWEAADGRLVGAVHPDGPGDAVLELDPDYRHLEGDMIAWAEEHLAVPDEESGRRRLDFFVWDYDVRRQRLLAARRYDQMPWSGVVRHLRLGCQPLPPVCMATGYTLRTTRANNEDCARIAALLNAAFNRTCHTAGEYRAFVTLNPAFRHDLNLIAEAPDGSCAAHVGLNFDPINHRAIFEPVCTHPDHRRKGLAEALMCEGLHRLRAIGARDVFVETGDAVAANALYDAIGFTEMYTGHVWRQVFAG